MRNKNFLIVRTGLTLCILLFLMGVTASAEESEGRLQDLDIIMIIDRSGTMSVNDPTYYELDAANQFMYSVASCGNYNDVRFNIFTFDTNIAQIYDTGSVSGKDGSIGTVETLINNIRYCPYDNDTTQGDTDMGQAMEKAAGILEDMNETKPDSKKVIVFMTDGKIKFTGDTNKKKAEASRAQLYKALEDIDCPVYVIALTDNTESGQNDETVDDAYNIGRMEGNWYAVATESADLDEIYDRIYMYVYNTKANTRENVEITPDNNAINIEKDSETQGITFRITDENGSGNLASQIGGFSIFNQFTNDTLSEEQMKEITDWCNTLNGLYQDHVHVRIIGIPAGLLEGDGWQIIFFLNDGEKENVNVTGYYLYNLIMDWKDKPDNTYYLEQEISISASVQGVDPSNFSVYAVLKKESTDADNNTVESVVSADDYRILRGTGSSITLYGEENKEEAAAIDAVEMEYDEENDIYAADISFSSYGNYKVYIYGENGKCFGQVSAQSFEVLNESAPDEKESLLDRLLEWVCKLLNGVKAWFLGMSLVKRIIVVAVGVFIVSMTYIGKKE